MLSTANSDLKVKGSVNPEIVKNIARYNFLIITVMYIKVYISGMEMSQKIHLWYQRYPIWPKMLIFEKIAKKQQQQHFLVKKNCDKLKNNFELEMLKLLENHVKTLLYDFFFPHFWIRQYFWKYWPKSAKKVIFWLFWSKFSYFLIQKSEKTVPRVVS